MVTYSLASGFSIHPAMIFVKKDIGGVACGRWWRWCVSEERVDGQTKNEQWVGLGGQRGVVMFKCGTEEETSQDR